VAARALDLYASAETITALRRRYARLDHCHFIEVREGERHRIGQLTISALTVPHALDPSYPTFAWKLRAGSNAIVYASDVAFLTSALRRFCRGACLDRDRRGTVKTANLLAPHDRRGVA
jgi:hypothetical protein